MSRQFDRWKYVFTSPLSSTNPPKFWAESWHVYTNLYNTSQLWYTLCIVFGKHKMASVIITATFLLFSFYVASIKGERVTGKSKHLFVQRREPLRGSSLPVHEIRLSKNGSSSSKSSQHVDHRSPRSRRAAESSSNTKRDPTTTWVSWFLWRIFCCFDAYLVKGELRC